MLLDKIKDNKWEKLPQSTQCVVIRRTRMNAYGKDEQTTNKRVEEKEKI